MSANQATKKTAAAVEPPSSTHETRYTPAEIEPKWQQRWAGQPDLYSVEAASTDKQKYYVL
jgi:leucyl-tRNA synthetase